MPTLKDDTKPRIFLLDDPAREKAHAANFTKEPEALAEYGKLIDAIYPVVLTRTLSTEALDKIACGMESRFKVVWSKAGDYLMVLSHYFPQALEQALSLARSNSASVRLRVVQSQSKVSLPEPHLTALLRDTLQDSSVQVRQFAASRCDTLGKTELIDDLRKQLDREEAPKVRHAIEFAISRLKSKDRY